MKRWQKKYQRDIEARVGQPCRIGWARSLCKIVLFYAEKHPEARVDADSAKKALELLENGSGVYGGLQIDKLTINRDKSGFKMDARVGWYKSEYVTVSNRGLPPVVTTYETLTN